MVDRDIEAKSIAQAMSYTTSSIYFVVIYRFFRGNTKIYLRDLKDKDGWSLTVSYAKAYQFTHQAHAEKALEEYCIGWGEEAKNFRVMKVTEEQYVQHSIQARG